MPCELHVVAGVYHGADNFAVNAPASAAFHASLTAALRRALSGAAVHTTGAA